MAKMRDNYREALRRLASSAEEQEQYLSELRTAPSADELALEFSDAFLVVQDELDANARRAGLDLDAYLETMSGTDNSTKWTVLALRRAPEWRIVRDLANRALLLFDGELSSNGRSPAK